MTLRFFGSFIQEKRRLPKVVSVLVCFVKSSSFSFEHVGKRLNFIQAHFLLFWSPGCAAAKKERKKDFRSSTLTSKQTLFSVEKKLAEEVESRNLNRKFRLFRPLRTKKSCSRPVLLLTENRLSKKSRRY